MSLVCKLERLKPFMFTFALVANSSVFLFKLRLSGVGKTHKVVRRFSKALFGIDHKMHEPQQHHWL